MLLTDEICLHTNFCEIMLNFSTSILSLKETYKLGKDTLPTLTERYSNHNLTY